MADAQLCPEVKVCNEHCPQQGDVVSYHTQIYLHNLFEIPLNKPPAEQIFNTISEIDCTKFIAVSVQNPPGKKVLIVGKVTVGIEYVEDLPEQKVHYAQWELPFQALIKQSDGSLLDFTFDINEYVANLCVENAEISMVDSKTVDAEVVLLVWLQKRTN